MDFIRDKLEESLLLRWIVANMAGWTVGLIAGGYLIRLPNLPTICFPLVCLIGGFAGACIGAAQWYILRQPYQINRRWIGYSFIGAAVATLPAYFIGVFLFLASMGASVLGSFAAIIMGALIGSGVGIGQSYVLQNHISDSARWWIAACAAAGGVCGLLSLMPILPPLPIGILTGTALYGYITGRMLLRLSRQAAS